MEKHACQNMVAMVTASYVNNDISYQIGDHADAVMHVTRQLSSKIEQFH